jgi:hypothetical protein
VELPPPGLSVSSVPALAAIALIGSDTIVSYRGPTPRLQTTATRSEGNLVGSSPLCHKRRSACANARKDAALWSQRSGLLLIAENKTTLNDSEPTLGTANSHIRRSLVRKSSSGVAITAVWCRCPGCSSSRFFFCFVVNFFDGFWPLHFASNLPFARSQIDYILYSCKKKINFSDFENRPFCRFSQARQAPSCKERRLGLVHSVAQRLILQHRGRH